MVEPVNRDRPPGRLGRLRSRIAISTRMPTRPSTPMISVARPKIVQCPMIGSPPVGVTTSKYASSTSSDSTTKPTITNQCAAPTTPHLSIRVWPSGLHEHRPGAGDLAANRSGAGCPSRMTATIFRTARTPATPPRR